MGAPRRQAVIKFAPSHRQSGRILLVNLRRWSMMEGGPRFKPSQSHLEVAVPLLVELCKALHIVFHGVDIESFSCEPGDGSG